MVREIENAGAMPRPGLSRPGSGVGRAPNRVMTRVGLQPGLGPGRGGPGTGTGRRATPSGHVIYNLSGVHKSGYTSIH